MMKRLRRRIFETLYPEDGTSWIDTGIILLITLNVVAVMLQTEPAIGETYAREMLVFEWFSSIFFTIEYVIRVWICVEMPQYSHPIKGRLRYAVSLMALVDLIAILPFYLPYFIKTDLRIVRAIRMFRLLRLLKMGRYAYAVQTLGAVISRKREEMAIAIFVTVLLTIISSSVMFFVEHTAQPEAFRSIPSTMWWTIVTMTSVGYGDVVPITGLGRFIGALICMLGVGMVALPTGIIAAGFHEHMREMKLGKDHEIFGYCPHCGRKLLPTEELE